MQGVDNEKTRFLQDWEAYLQIGEKAAVVWKKTFRQGAEAANKCEKLLSVKRKSNNNKKPPNQDTKQTQSPKQKGLPGIDMRGNTGSSAQDNDSDIIVMPIQGKKPDNADPSERDEDLDTIVIPEPDKDSDTVAPPIQSTNTSTRDKSFNSADGNTDPPVEDKDSSIADTPVQSEGVNNTATPPDADTDSTDTRNKDTERNFRYEAKNLKIRESKLRTIIFEGEKQNDELHDKIKSIEQKKNEVPEKNREALTRELETAWGKWGECETVLKAQKKTIELIERLTQPLFAYVPEDESATANPYQIKAATGVAVPDTVQAYQASIEDSDGSVPNVNVANPESINKPVVEAVDRLTEHLVSVFPPDKPDTPDMPDFDKDGFWVPQDDYATRIGRSSDTLSGYREARYNPVRLANGVMKIRGGHFCRQTGDKDNSPFEFFVQYTPESKRRG